MAAFVAGLDVDDDVFPTFAVPEKSVSAALAFGLGLTWWPTRDARLMLDYCQTGFDGGAGTASVVEDRPTERAILSRLQLVF